jgi:hypothetical protein
MRKEKEGREEKKQDKIKEEKKREKKRERSKEAGFRECCLFRVRVRVRLTRQN